MQQLVVRVRSKIIRRDGDLPFQGIQGYFVTVAAVLSEPQVLGYSQQVSFWRCLKRYFFVPDFLIKYHQRVVKNIPGIRQGTVHFSDKMCCFWESRFVERFEESLPFIRDCKFFFGQCVHSSCFTV